ncbi:MAG: methyltransferase domain-containing protein [Bryobacteraceae bacterium]
MSVLHFAPEKSLKKVLANQPHLRYITTDLCEPTDVNMDITRLAIPNDTFDAILCSHVLEHIPDDAAAMRELHRVLKPNGLAILQVPLDMQREHTYEDFSITDPAERRKHFGQEDHVRMYGRDYKTRLQAAGFQVNVDSYVKTLGPDKAKRYGLMEEDLYLCTKLA